MDARHPDLCDAARSTLVVVDVQERLLPAIADGARIEAEAARVIAGAKLHAIPILATLQYPKGLGGPTRAIADALGAAPRIEKTSFSCADEPSFMKALRALDRDQVVLVGVEAHVCVLQTAFDLRARGFRVVVVADAVGSRSVANRSTALDDVSRAGARVAAAESVLFEWTRFAAGPGFKAISALVR
jgi:nicotinamidase-related amidase